MNILLTNIWNRNIRYLDEFIEKSYDKQQWRDKNNFYDLTKMIYQDIDNEKNNLKIEILDIILEKFNIDKIYLFVTNQNDPFHQDTYYAWKIIEYVLKDKYKVEVIEQKKDPRNRVEAFKFFEDFFEKESNLLNKSDLIVSWSWWVPAMKEALNFYSVIKNTKNSTIIDLDEKTKEIFSSNIQNEYLKNFDKKILIKMIENYDYSWAYIFLKNSKINNIQLENNLLYINNRYNFNFDKANNLLNNFSSKIVNKKIKLNNDFISKDVLFELFDNLEISYEKWEYSAMLWKVYSLYENLIKFFYEDIYNISINNHVELKKNLIEFSKNEYNNNEFPKIISLKSKVENNYKYKELFWKESFFNKLYNLKNNRNNSIVAHWLDWVNNSISNELYDLIKYIKKFFWIKENVFHQINKELINKINNI